MTTVDPQEGTVNRSITNPVGDSYTTSGGVRRNGAGIVTVCGTGRQGREGSITIDRD
ncbi:hypothetical protein [Thiohalocapsa sp.]|uniref:hypothetical protein n=1 Tax=Thiohalocapsa sp. TaxID=2497641 RepID=UPI0025CF57F8|nr:hypothetical protein [Thiohalocapsa sp.]